MTSSIPDSTDNLAFIRRMSAPTYEEKRQELRTKNNWCGWINN